MRTSRKSFLEVVLSNLDLSMIFTATFLVREQMILISGSDNILRSGKSAFYLLSREGVCCQSHFGKISLPNSLFQIIVSYCLRFGFGHPICGRPSVQGARAVVGHGVMCMLEG